MNTSYILVEYSTTFSTNVVNVFLDVVIVINWPSIGANVVVDPVISTKTEISCFHLPSDTLRICCDG